MNTSAPLLAQGRIESDVAKANRVVAPYVTAWSAEQDLRCRLVVRAGGTGVGYASELPGDRDERGVLWAMRELLCQVCAGLPGRTRDGVLWLMRDHREDWPCWPEGIASVEPPVCAACVPIAMRRCPALQRGAVAVRAREFPIAGVRGTLYRPGMFGPVAVEAAQLAHGDPLTCWLVAAALIRELRECSFIPFDELCDVEDVSPHRDV